MAIIGIIVPVYNSEKYLRKCLDSILKQSFSDFKLVLIDDGSSDSSLLICKEYEEKDNRIVVFHIKNNGPSSARNIALNYVFSKNDIQYIAFVDSDDYIEEEYLDVLYNHIDNSDISICSTTIEDSDYNIIGSVDLPYSGRIDEYKYWDLCFKTLYGWIVYPVCRLFKKTLFNNLRYREHFFHEDQEILHKIISQTKTMFVSSKPLYHYVRHGNSVSTNTSQYASDCFFDSLMKRARYFLSKEELHC